MERYIRRQLNQVLGRLAGEDWLTIVVDFPARVFAEAPVWNPGPDFRPCIAHYSWWRDDGRLGTITAVVAGLGPKRYPAWDGGVWTEPEVWEVCLPPEHWVFPALWDKPHRLSWLLDPGDDDGIEPRGTIIDRQPLAGHPAEAVKDYWARFEEQWDFVPERQLAWPLEVAAPYRLTMHWCTDETVTLSEIARGLAWLLRRFEGRLRVYRSTTDTDLQSQNSLSITNPWYMPQSWPNWISYY